MLFLPPFLFYFLLLPSLPSLYSCSSFYPVSLLPCSASSLLVSLLILLYFRSSVPPHPFCCLFVSVPLAYPPFPPSCPSLTPFPRLSPPGHSPSTRHSRHPPETQPQRRHAIIVFFSKGKLPWDAPGPPPPSLREDSADTKSNSSNSNSTDFRVQFAYTRTVKDKAMVFRMQIASPSAPDGYINGEMDAVYRPIPSRAPQVGREANA